MSKTLKIEISFPVPVNFPDGWERALDALVGMVCEHYQRENPTMVMWPAGYGSKITSMGMVAGDEHIDFDDSVYAIECCAREDWHGDNPHNPQRELFRHRAQIERAIRKGQPVETLVNGVWIDAEVKPLPFHCDWDNYDYRLPRGAHANQRAGIC